MRRSTSWYALAAVSVLSACNSSAPPPGVKIGKPYSINGRTYYPAYDASYDETGIASWYGPGFHGKRTANGEVFNKYDLTAAHPTLPMPSLVRVTNLENGKSLIVRINDRGPFASNRLIDLSKVSAQKLGITGLAKVRVQYLAKESEQYIAAVAEGRRIDIAALNEQAESEKNTSILAATAPSEQSFIIESTENQTRPGDTVANAAPIVSVSNADLPSAEKKPRGGLIIRDAQADEIGHEVVLKSPNIQPVPEVENENIVQVPEAKRTTTNATAMVSGSYYVQVGSFSQQANADSMQRAIESVAPSSVARVDINGAVWWRLRAGPFVTSEDAAQALDKIRSLGAPDARVMKL